MTKKELKAAKTAILRLFKRNLRAGASSLCTDFEDTLDLTRKELTEALHKLFAEKKLEFFGNEIFPYRRGFRFPEEIRFILRRLLRTDINSKAYVRSHKIVEMIEESVNKAKILKPRSGSKLWGKCFPSIQPDVCKYLHRHFGYLAKIDEVPKKKQGKNKGNPKLATGK